MWTRMCQFATPFWSNGKTQINLRSSITTHGVCVTVSRRAVIDKESCCMMMSGEDSLAVLLVLFGQGLMQIYYFLRAPNEDLGYARARDRSAVRTRFVERWNQARRSTRLGLDTRYLIWHRSQEFLDDIAMHPSFRAADPSIIHVRDRLAQYIIKILESTFGPRLGLRPLTSARRPLRYLLRCEMSARNAPSDIRKVPLPQLQLRQKKKRITHFFAPLAIAATPTTTSTTSTTTTTTTTTTATSWSVTSTSTSRATSTATDRHQLQSIAFTLSTVSTTLPLWLREEREKRHQKGMQSPS
jgi:hypothetical protein